MKARRSPLALWGSILLLGLARAVASDWDSRFFLSGIQGEVRSVATRGNEVFAGGKFTSADHVPVTNVARWSGTNWSPLGGGISGPVEALALWGTNVFAGGTFTQASGANALRVARWDGTRWWPMGAGIGGIRVSALAVDDAGVLYAGGEFTNAGGVAVANIARWDGTNWSGLGSGLRNDPYAAWVLALATHGTDVYAGGFFTEAGGANVSCVARWNGSAWSSLGGGVDDRDYLPQVTALAFHGGDLYVGGAFTSAGGVNAAHVAKWDGANWASLGSGLDRFFGEIPVASLAASEGRLVVVGRFVSVAGSAAENVAIWDGMNWRELGGGAPGRIYSVACRGSNVVVGGNYSVVGRAGSICLGQWNGAAWSNFTAGAGQGVAGARSCVQISLCTGDSVAALVATGGVMYAGGAFSVAGETPAANVGSWNGSEWSPLGGGIAGPVAALLWHGSELIAAGAFSSAGYSTASNIARWDGGQWYSLGGGINGPVFTLASSDAGVFAGGLFSAAGGTAASNIARWDGAAWTSVGSGLNGPVHALAVQGGNLFAGGRFTMAGETSAANIARWDGVRWSALGSGVSGIANAIPRIRPPPVSALAVSGGDLLVGGDFAFAGGMPATNVARWNGGSWSGLAGGLPGPNAYAPPPAIGALLVCDGRLFAAGSFVRAGLLNASGLAVWDGSNWTVFNGISGAADSLPSIGAMARVGDSIAVGGHFKFAGGFPASNLGVLQFPPGLSIRSTPNTVEISWVGSFTAYSLESTENLYPASWRMLTNLPAAPGSGMRVTLPASNRSEFFRLSR